MKSLRRIWKRWVIPAAYEYKQLDIARAKETVSRASSETIGQVYEFSSTMMNEVVERSGRLDTKAMSTLGWASALLGFLLVAYTEMLDHSKWIALIILLPIVLSAFLALGSVIISFMAFRAHSEWSWPSETTWLPITEMENANGPIDKIKRLHLYALFRAHQDLQVLNAWKGVRTVWGQTLLAAAALTTGLTIPWVGLMFLGRLIFSF